MIKKLLEQSVGFDSVPHITAYNPSTKNVMLSDLNGAYTCRSHILFTVEHRKHQMLQFHEKKPCSF